MEETAGAVKEVAKTTGLAINAPYAQPSYYMVFDYSHRFHDC